MIRRIKMKTLNVCNEHETCDIYRQNGERERERSDCNIKCNFGGFFLTFPRFKHSFEKWRGV